MVSAKLQSVLDPPTPVIPKRINGSQVPRSAIKINEPADPRLVERYMPLVKQVLKTIVRHLPKHVDTDDLYGIGLLGLMTALPKYNPLKEKTLSGYLVLRIRGAIIDELRRMDYLPRSARSRADSLRKTSERLEQRYGRPVQDHEIRREMGLDDGEFRNLLLQIQPIKLISFDNPELMAEELNLHEAIPDENHSRCYDQVQYKERRRMLFRNIRKLPARQQSVLLMYYFRGLRFNQIARIISVSAPRICQIHHKALKNLRQIMTHVPVP